MSKIWREKTNKMQQLNVFINFCLNMFWASSCPSSGEQRPCYRIWCVVLLLLDVVGSGCGALSCRMWSLWRLNKNLHSDHILQDRPTTATNHIQQNQNNTPNAVTGPLFSWRWVWWCPKHVETEVNKKHLIVASCWSSLFIIQRNSFCNMLHINAK